MTLYWRGAIAFEGIPTTDQRIIRPLGLDWSLPLPVTRPATEHELPDVVGSILDVWRQPLPGPPGLFVIVGFGRYRGDRWAAGDQASFAISLRPADVRDEQVQPVRRQRGPSVLLDVVAMSGQLYGAVLGGDNPAWPEAVVTFTSERPE